MVHRSGYGPESTAARHARPVPSSGSRLSPGSTRPDPAPQDPTPHRAQVTIRDIPRPLPVTRGDITLHVAVAVAVAVLAITLLVALFWPR
jgi:hypothetical protein